MTPDRPDETLAPLITMIDEVWGEALANGNRNAFLNELTAQRRLSAEKDAKLAALESRVACFGRELDDWCEKEASCCPEDTSFVDVIKYLREQLAEQSATLARLEQELDEAREHEH